MASIEKNMEKINRIQQNLNETNVRVYGIYPGNIESFVGDAEKIDILGEFELFMFISSLTNYLNAWEQVASFNADDAKDIKETIYALEYLVSKTVKFGVELQRDKNGRLSTSNDYLEWYRYHSKHFSKTLSKEELQRFLTLKQRGYSLSKYLPDDSYLDYKIKRNANKSEDVEISEPSAKIIQYRNINSRSKVFNS